MRSPYRIAPTPEARRVALPDGDILPVYAVLWLGSIARVAAGLARDESFGTEVTLATLVVVLLPWLAGKAAAAWWAQRAGRDARRRRRTP